MTRLLLISILFFNANLLFAQNWKDSLFAGQTAFQQRQFKKALRLFKHAQDLAPKGVNIQELVNQSAYRGKNYNEAEKGYSNALKKAKTKTEKSTTNYNLGNAQFKNKNIDQAIESYKDALRANPNNDQARYNLAYALNQKNKNKNNQSKNNQKNKNDNKQNKNKKNQQQNQQNKPKQGDKGQQQSQPNQLNKKQANRLLDALARADKEAQKKLNKKKDTAKAILLNKKNW